MPHFPDDYFTAILKGVPHDASGLADCADLSDMSEQFTQWVYENGNEDPSVPEGVPELLEKILQAYTGWLRKHGYMRDQRKWVNDIVAAAIAEAKAEQHKQKEADDLIELSYELRRYAEWFVKDHGKMPTDVRELAEYLDAERNQGRFADAPAVRWVYGLIGNAEAEAAVAVIQSEKAA